MAQISEGLFTTDKYNKPMLLHDKDAIAILLLRLLVMTPGTNPLHPEMGVDIWGRYEYCNEDELDELNEEIESQILAYLPNFSSCKVTAELDSERQMKVSIYIDGSLFQYSTAGADQIGENEISLK